MMATILGSQDSSDLLARTRTLSSEIGFNTFMVGLERRSDDGRIAHVVWSDYPSTWQQEYQHHHYQLIDPTVPYCQKTTTPLIWSLDFFANAGAGFMLEEARSHGLHHGISLAVHDRFGTKSMMSLVRDKPLSSSQAETEHMLNCSLVLSACVHQVAHQILEKDSTRARVDLTVREKECLQWIAIGKSTADISDILNVSEATVSFHVKNLMYKLDVHTRPQALAKAMRMGLVG